MRPVSKTIRLVAGAFASSAQSPRRTRRLCLQSDLAIAVHHADVRLVHRDVQSSKVFHDCPPLYIREPILSAPRRAATSLLHVAKVFCRLWRATLIRNDEQQCNFDSL